MSLEKRIEIQKKFASLNIIWLVFATTVMIIQFLENVDRVSLIPLYIVIALWIVDFLLTHHINISDERKLMCFGVLRYTQAIVSIFAMCCTMNGSSTFIVYCFIALVLSIIECLMLYDVYDSMQMSLCFITLVLAMCFIPLLANMMFVQIDTSIIYMYLFFANLAVAFLYLSRMFIDYMKKNTKELMYLRRLVESTEETNVALSENQEKVKRANELLGVQKVKLEAAYEKINSVNAEMMIQNQIISFISSSLELGKVMQLITETVFEKMRVEACAIVLYPNATFNSKVLFKVKTNIPNNCRQLLVRHIENYCFDPYISEGETYVDNHVTNKYDFLMDNLLGSILIIPFVKNKKVIGALFVGHSTYDYFYDNKDFYEAIVSQFMIALDNANLYKKMESMAIRDGLTGIYNRRFLTKMFQETIKNAVRNNQSVSVVLFDIDFFKRINDTYGHVFGDTAIQAIAKLGFSTAKERGGIIGRYGGEEFVIIFPNKDVKEAYNIIIDLHNRIKSMKLQHTSGDVYIDVSMGLTSYPETCKNPEELLSRADWAMYYSKQNGRGCITIDSDEVQKSVDINWK